MNLKSKFDIGDLVFDRITGFEGIVTGILMDVARRIQYAVSPQVNIDRLDIAQSIWIDEIRLKIKEKNSIDFYGENNRPKLKPIK